MSWENDEEWFEDFWEWPSTRRRSRRGTAGFEPFEPFRTFDRMFEQMFRGMTKDFPKELVQERRLPDGSVMRSYGPLVYGYSVSVGPDGKPVVTHFGNVKPGRSLGGRGPALEASDVREPLVDVLAEEDKVKVLAELPGVEKSDIQLQCHDNILEISVNTSGRKYKKTVELPSEVDPDVSQAKYTNGVLEVTLTARKPTKPQGKQIKIE